MENFIGFMSNNVLNIILIAVTSFALVVYILQERKRVTEAASLIKI